MKQRKISEQLKLARERAQLSQLQVAKSLNVSRQTISSWETGRNTPDIESLQLLADVYGVTVDELVYGRKQNVLSLNKQVAQILLGTATGAMLMGRLIMSVPKEMRFFQDWLIVFAIILNVVMYKEITTTRIFELFIYDLVIFTSAVFNVFDMGVSGETVLIISLIMFLLSTAFFVKDRRIILPFFKRNG